MFGVHSLQQSYFLELVGEHHRPENGPKIRVIYIQSFINSLQLVNVVLNLKVSQSSFLRLQCSSEVL